MPDYSKGKIYKIWDSGFNKCYIGSTVEDLSQRMVRHRTKYKSWKEGKRSNTASFQLFDEFGVENCKIVLLENYPCNSKEELFARETFYQKTHDCVNVRLAKRSSSEYYQDLREELIQKTNKYKKDNPEKVKSSSKQYWERKRDELLRKVECECGSVYCYCDKARHLKTKKHQQYINQSNPQE